MSHLKLYFGFVKIGFSRMSENRGSFIWTNISKGVHFAANILLLWIMIDKFKAINGWMPFEVMLLFSINFASYSFAACFFMHPCINLSERVRTGEFDEVLTKPLNHFFYYFSREASFGYASNVFVSLSIIVLSFIKLNIDFSFVNLLFLIVVLFSGCLINGAFFIIGSVPAFWVIKSEGLMHIFVSGIRAYIRYPISIYHHVIQIILTFVIPYAFVNFFPVQHFLKKSDFLMFNPVFQYLSPVAGIVFIILAYFFWKIGINHYKSSGS